MTFDEVVSFYLVNHQHRSKWRDNCSLARLEPHFRGRPITDIRRPDVRAYITKRQADGVQLATARRELRFMSAAINYTNFELELNLPNPVKGYCFAHDEGRVRWITQEEAARLVRIAGTVSKFPHLQQFIRLALNTGCRKSELLLLEWSRVDLRRKLFYLDVMHTKSGKRRAVPLNAGASAAMQAMRQWIDQECPGNPWVFGRGQGRFWRIESAFRRAREQAGLNDFRIHDMRHTCASWLVMAGIDLGVVRDLLGHSSIAVTERYAHLSPRMVASAVDQIPLF